NRGIVEAFHGGIVTSTSLLANGAAFAGGVDAARSAPGLGIGVHLNLSDGPGLAAGPESLLWRRANSPSSFKRLATLSGLATAGPSLKFRCTPIPRPGAERAASTPPANAAPLASSEVLVTIPLWNASTMPRFTPSVHPRSSALTIRFFTACPTPLFSPVHWDSYLFARTQKFVPLTLFVLNSSMAR